MTTWDGKDLAVIQMLAAGAPRVHGQPAARVDAYRPSGPPGSRWNLSVLTDEGIAAVPVGHAVVAGEDGHLSVVAP